MNFKRGLIRLWVFASVIWIIGVVMVAIDDPKLHRSDIVSVDSLPDDWTPVRPPSSNYVVGEEVPAPILPAPGKPGHDPNKDPNLEPVDHDPFAFMDSKPQAKSAIADGSIPLPLPRDAILLRTAIWKYARLAFGVPIAVLILSAGFWWVMIGFRSGPRPEA